MLPAQDPIALVECGPRPVGPDRESVTPHKLSLLALVQQYSESRQQLDAPLTARQRKDTCLLLLQLLQGPELDGARLLVQLRRRLPPEQLSGLCRRLQRLRDAGVEGLSELVAGVKQLIAEAGPRRLAVSCSSVVGFFVRRMVLAFTRLPFHEVTRVYAEFAAYHAAGRFPDGAEEPPVPTMADSADCMDLGDVSDAAVVSIGGDDEEQADDSCSWVGQRPSRRQAELLVSTQMELLQTNERRALPPAQLQEVTSRLLRDNPDLAEAHFLSFLNCLRSSELCGAVHSLYHSFDRMGAGGDEPSRGLRYAALSLASLHARFGHRGAALAALREAVTMSQDSNDSRCLQQALTWLYKLTDDEEARQRLMRHAIAKSGELDLHELASLGVQNYTEMMARRGAKPTEAFEQLAISDQINCQHSLPALLASAYSVRSALCSLYGRPGLAHLCSQLLLCIDTSGSGRHGAPVCGEPVALAAGTVARHLAGQGEYARAEQVLSWAAEQFPPAGAEARLVRQQWLEMEAERALLAGRCESAQEAATALTALDPASGRLRRAQLHLLRGEPAECEQLLAQLLAAQPPPVPERLVQLLLLRAELRAASADYAGAAEPLLAALAECQRRRLRGARCSVLLRLAAVQLQLGLRGPAAQLAEKLALPLLTHGSLHERARLYLLRARCLLAEEPPRRRDALPLLEEAAHLLTRLQAWLLLKTVFHLRAVTFHELDERAERNTAASQYRQLMAQHPTLDGVHLMRIS
ncbi:Anaphase-promoting complex subunit 5 [Amphibalanus amphitrite]|uniref:Anaphase-promoting complex subunit 5 n=1 Tax=Amphibalanus amphitrite TaxID=1232801 RepID=A0A6A4WXI3_AMPAM|nr:anaphase-promoting complex subunit 5-like [Amphibalanus amphitrite]XP_043199953.1 anaphase-promoting complex subunit 5-like [Amphibalanus amphitrite]XP_043199963.1 anaphase-promoting complex subunit 5-like [Amphibalanus amphitrite]KAF0309999.1 Anaphase-promoting complex subunit 5 [Amphibalanus amphitrite]